MRQTYGKNHIGDLPSPVAGMNMGKWLGRARMTEDQLLAFLERTDLEPAQKAKMQGLLRRIRSKIADQLDRIR